MRPGPLEIILIIAVIIAVVIVARILRSGRIAARESAKISGRKKNSPRSIISRTGITFIVIGVIVFFAGISVLRWAFQSYIWSFVLVVIGFLMFILARKKG